jgi:small GTP-binding protein
MIIMEKRTIKLKACLVGENAVGKTSLVKSFVNGEFNDSYVPTIGANVLIKNIEVFCNDVKYEVSMSVWDLAGQDQWSKMRSLYLRATQGVFFVGDLTRLESFRKINSYWSEEVKKYVPKDIPRILICNKADLKQEVSNNYIGTLRYKLNFDSVIKTSAKLKQNVNYAFLYLISRYVKIEQSFLMNLN